MIREIAIDALAPHSGFQQVLEAWEQPDTKVVVMRATEPLAAVREFYEAHFGSIGTPFALGEDVTIGGREAQRSGEIWMEVRYDPRFPDAYRHSANAQPLHTDGSYIPDFPNATLMACVANSGTGGETTFIDAEALVAVMVEEDPELLDQLTSRTLPHARSGDQANEKVVDRRNDGVWLNWNYFCVDPAIDSAGRALADKFHQFLLHSPGVKAHTHGVKLTPGDAVTWKDRRVLHGRNSFVATQDSERFLWKCAIDIGQFAH